MANEITTNKAEVLRALQIAENKVFVAATLFVDELSKRVAEEGKTIIEALGAVDTMAMQASIEGKITTIEPGVAVHGEVTFGNDRVSRGYGRFTMRHKGAGPEATIKGPTIDYVEALVEGKGISKKKGRRDFPRATFDYLKAVGEKTLAKVMNAALRRL